MLEPNELAPGQAQSKPHKSPLSGLSITFPFRSDEANYLRRRRQNGAIMNGTLIILVSGVAKRQRGRRRQSRALHSGGGASCKQRQGNQLLAHSAVKCTEPPEKKLSASHLPPLPRSGLTNR